MTYKELIERLPEEIKSRMELMNLFEDTVATKDNEVLEVLFGEDELYRDYVRDIISRLRGDAIYFARNVSNSIHHDANYKRQVSSLLILDEDSPYYRARGLLELLGDQYLLPKGAGNRSLVFKEVKKEIDLLVENNEWLIGTNWLIPLRAVPNYSHLFGEISSINQYRTILEENKGWEFYEIVDVLIKCGKL